MKSVMISSKLYSQCLNFQPLQHLPSSNQSYHSKQNVKESINVQEYSERVSRYPQIESKISRLLIKIDTLASENIRLKQCLDYQRQLRFDLEENYKREVENYQAHQQEIQSFVTELESKVGNLNTRRQSTPTIQLLEKKQNLEIDLKESNENTFFVYQKKIQQLTRDLDNKTKQLDDTKSNLKESQNQLKIYNSKIQELKQLIKQINLINEDLANQNESLRKSRMKKQEFENHKPYLQSRSVPIQLEIKQNLKLHAYEVQIESKNQEIQDLLLGVCRLENKLQKSYIYIHLLEQENTSLRERNALI